MRACGSRMIAKASGTCRAFTERKHAGLKGEGSAALVYRVQVGQCTIPEPLV